jgi:Domain of unknown function (DUF5655)
MGSPRTRPLWTCPRCKRQFAHTNQAHSCGSFELDALFEGADESVKRLFDLFAEAVRANGDVTVIPEKTRVAFQVRMSFAAVVPRRSWLDGHLVLAQTVSEPWVRKVDVISARNQVHHFRLREPSDLTPALRACLRDAYAVGEQRHL